MRESRFQSGIARAAVGAVVVLALSACQTPWTTAILQDAQPVLEPTPVVVETPAEVPAAPADVVAPTEPSLKGRVAALLVERAPDMRPVDRARVAGAIETAYRNHRVDPVLVLAVIRQESHFRANAHGAGNSIGLMQVRPFVGADVARRHNIPWAGAKTLLDPAANVQIGACYLGEMLEMFHDPGLAIAAYNMGPTRVRRMVARGHIPKPAYLGSVLKHVQAIASELGEIPPEPITEALAE
ncbi:MAG: transglycosylase SLT domain-containing protein [Myxococcota bacterium]